MPLEPDDRDPSVVIDQELPAHPIKRGAGEDARVATGEGYKGFTPDFPTSTETNKPGLTIDPTDPNTLIMYGGVSLNDAGREGGTVSELETVRMEYTESAYSDASGNIGAIGATDEHEAPAAEAFVDTNEVVVTGGEIAGSVNDGIFVLDVPGDTWSSLTSTLPTGVFGPASQVVDGTMYVIGGTDGTDTATDQVVSIDPAADTVTTLTSAPAPLSGRVNSAQLNGYIYVAGQGSTSFYRYDTSADSWETLANMDVLYFEGGSVGNGDSAFADGVMWEHNGYIGYQDGANYFGGQSTAYYDPETDTWVGFGDDLPDSVFYHFGNKVGEIIDGVLICPTENADREVVYAYVPFDEPFDE